LIWQDVCASNTTRKFIQLRLQFRTGIGTNQNEATGLDVGHFWADFSAGRLEQRAAAVGEDQLKIISRKVFAPVARQR
jgi:hypothetical protein